MGGRGGLELIRNVLSRRVAGGGDGGTVGG